MHFRKEGNMATSKYAPKPPSISELEGRPVLTTTIPMLTRGVLHPWFASEAGMAVQAESPYIRLVLTDRVIGDPSYAEDDVLKVDPHYRTHAYLEITPPVESIVGYHEYEALVASQPRVMELSRAHAEAERTLKEAATALDSLCDGDEAYGNLFQEIAHHVSLRGDQRRGPTALEDKIAEYQSQLRQRRAALAKEQGLNMKDLDVAERKARRAVESETSAFWRIQPGNRKEMQNVWRDSLITAGVDANLLRESQLVRKLVYAFLGGRGNAYNLSDDLLGPEPEPRETVHQPLYVRLSLIAQALLPANANRVVWNGPQFVMLTYTGSMTGGDAPIDQSLYGNMIVGVVTDDVVYACVLGMQTWRLLDLNAQRIRELRLTDRFLGFAREYAGIVGSGAAPEAAGAPRRAKKPRRRGKRPATPANPELAQEQPAPTEIAATPDAESAASAQGPEDAEVVEEIEVSVDDADNDAPAVVLQ